MKKKTLVIGLTGGIASGKSLVLAQFRKLGAHTLDCDRIAKDVVRQGKIAYLKIVDKFGDPVLHKNGKLDRVKLGELVFLNPRKRILLESIVHPQVIQKLRQEIKLAQCKLLVIDIPLLFEAKLKKLVNKVVVVWAPLKEQYDRLQKRDRLSYGDARKRIQSQWSLKKKCQWANFVIDNSKTSAYTRFQVKSLYSTLTKKD